MGIKASIPAHSDPQYPGRDSDALGHSYAPGSLDPYLSAMAEYGSDDQYGRSDEEAAASKTKYDAARALFHQRNGAPE